MSSRSLLWGCLVLCVGHIAWAVDVDPKVQSAKAAFLATYRLKQPLERVAATTALGEFAQKEVVELLLNKGCLDPDSRVQFAARQALTRLAEDRAIRQILFDDWKRGLRKPSPHWADQLRALVEIGRAHV